MVGRGIPRHGLAVLKDGAEVGIVTSGTHSPTLDDNIGMGYVDRGHSDEGTRFEIDVRGRLVEAEVVPLPFYSRKRS
jgi:aminomethyltransferase